MNFVEYDRTTGDIVGYGFMEDIYVQKLVDEKKPVIITQDICPSEFWKVDLSTLEVVKKNPFQPAIPPGFSPQT